MLRSASASVQGVKTLNTEVMVFTKEVTLPSEEELTVQEVEISTPGLRAASFHMGKACENVNNVSILCY